MKRFFYFITFFIVILIFITHPFDIFEIILNHTGYQIKNIQGNLINHISVAYYFDPSPKHNLEIININSEHEIHENTILVKKLSIESIKYLDPTKPNISLKKELLKSINKLPSVVHLKGEKEILIQELTIDSLSIQVSASSKPIHIKNILIKNLNIHSHSSLEILSFESDNVIYDANKIQLLLTPDHFQDLKTTKVFSFMLNINDIAIHKDVFENWIKEI